MLVAAAGDGLIHDLVDDDGWHQARPVGQAGRACGQGKEISAGIGPPAHRDAAALVLKINRVDDPVLVRVDEEDAFAGGAQAEEELRLDEMDVARRPEDGAVGDAILVGCGGVAQPGAGQIYWREAVVVQLNVVLQRKIGVGKEFIDDHRAYGISADWFGAAG